jgi:hypothetical protein
VDEGSRFNPYSAGCLETLCPRSIAADSNDKMRVARGSEAREFSPGSGYAATLKFPRQLPRGVIDENDTGETALCSNDIKNDFAVSTGTPYNQLVHGFVVLSILPRNSGIVAWLPWWIYWRTQNASESQPEDLKVEGQTLVVHVPRIQFKLLLPSQCIAAINLRPAGYAGLDLVAP